MFENLLNQFKIVALEQITRVEIWAKEQLLTTGKKLTGAEKKAEAKRLVKEWYRTATAGTFLGQTTIDDSIVDAAADAAIDFVFTRAGELVNQLSALLPERTVTAPELPEGGLK